VIRRLTLENWRAYEHLALDFQPGATFVVAPNGVGKSSIVEAARFALFGNVAPAREGAARVARTGTTSASVDVELPSGRLLSVTRPYPAKPRGSTTPAVILDGETEGPETLEALLAEEYGAEPAFLARLAMLHSSTVFAEAKGLDLRDHLCRVFGVDGLVAALDQTKTLAAVAKKTVDSARKPTAAVPDTELAALAEVEARAAELIAASDTERAEAEQALTAARSAAEARRRHETWRAAADRYAAVAAEVAGEAEALLGRPLSAGGGGEGVAGNAEAAGAAGGDERLSQFATLPAQLEAAEAAAIDTLDGIRRRRAALAGQIDAIRAGLTELQSAEGACPVCRRPLEPDDVEVARAGHERDLAELETELSDLDDAAAARLVAELRRLRHRLVNEPAPGDPSPQPDAGQAVTSEDEAMERFEAAVATAAERRAILAEARRRREAGESARVELEAVTAAFERAATLEAASAALEAARLRILTESVEPLEELLAENWRNLFVDRPGVGLDGDGSVSRRIGSELLQYEQFSDGEKMVTQLLLRVLVLRATTRLGFFWVDEPLEHLDPDARRALAVLLAQAPEDPSFRQVLVTTYEEPLIRRLRGSIPNTHLVYVRPSAA
jgi:DNA repair exonuclease SbcCD ATPase subunit